jgi:glycine cleavage system aminomethyltransferase T
LLKQREGGIGRRLVQFLLKDPEALLIHDEPILKNGELVGRVASAQYGHSLGGAVALGWVAASFENPERAWFENGNYEIEVAGQRVSAVASLTPMYDAKSERPKS